MLLLDNFSVTISQLIPTKDGGSASFIIAGTVGGQVMDVDYHRLNSSGMVREVRGFVFCTLLELFVRLIPS